MERTPGHRRELTEQEKLNEAIEFMREKFGRYQHADVDCFGVEHTSRISNESLQGPYEEMCEAYGPEIANEALGSFQYPRTTIVN